MSDSGLVGSILVKDRKAQVEFEKYSKQDVLQQSYEIPLGVADIKKQGKDLTVIATSFMVQKTLKVVDKLSEEEISIEVVDPRTIKPLDIDLIAFSIKKTNRAVLVEEACYTGGFTCFFASEIYKNCFDFLNAPIERVAALDCPISYEHKLENVVIPDEKKIEEAIKKVLGR